MKVLCTGGSGFIGMHVVDSILEMGGDLVNIDIISPKDKKHIPYWRECNILDVDRLNKIFFDFNPTHVIHLAARATMEGRTMDDFIDNTVGTSSLLSIIKNRPSVERVIVTSSQHVRKPGSGLPVSDQDFVPHGLYGESKVITEKITRQSALSCGWVIIRPTTIWGPNHPFLPAGLWKWMYKGLYFHPANDMVVRGYGYVKNIAWQILQLLDAPDLKVCNKVFYVGDEVIKQIDWVRSFSKALINRDVCEVPLRFIYLLSKMGDLMKKFGLKFPMDGPRYFNLTTNNPVSMKPIIDLFGPPPYSMLAGVDETVVWLKKNKYLSR